MNYISSYLLSVFQFAAGSGKTAFDKGEWLAFSGKEGEWFYALYEKKAKNSKAMREAVDRLFLMDNGQRDRIYRAIRHDMEFALDRTKRFEFESILLKKEEQKLIEDFFLYFYKEVLCSAHFHLKGLSRSGYGRKEFADAFFKGTNEAIKNICPVCLQTMTNAKKEDDVEHYFAKAFVPCLALHPYNLYFICKPCNQIYKKQKRPFYGRNKDVRKIFLPYIDTVRDKVKIVFDGDDERDWIRFVPADPGEDYIEEKIKAFDRLFQMEERWSGMLECYYNENCKMYHRMNIQNMAALGREIDADAAAMKFRPDRYLEAEYLEWIGGSHLKAFYSNMQHDGRRGHFM